ncbi:MAG TPA: YbhB/YbcL family Raf kinase inhibitor-like protein, partial [Planctomycetota bacterium]|nr:YbhB/YbcL family Raf kinase inhibitor-like protein [Planctomycetota bacterium]
MAAAGSLVLSSPAFAEGQPIPAAYTCDGPGRSPPLSWSGAPPGTQSFVLIVDDPDTPPPSVPSAIVLPWRFHSSQWSHVPRGASGSSTI